MGADEVFRLIDVSPVGRDSAKGMVVTLIPTGMGFILSGWVVGVICLFIAGGLSLILWTPLGHWLDFHSHGDSDSADTQQHSASIDPAPQSSLADECTELAKQIRDFAAKRKLSDPGIHHKHNLPLDEEERQRREQSQYRHETGAEFNRQFGADARRLLEALRDMGRLDPGALAAMEIVRLSRANPNEVDEIAYLLTKGAHELQTPNSAPATSTQPPLAAELDSMMHGGMKLLDELMVPAQPKETRNGEWALEFGEAPAEWNDKANTFYRQARNLLRAEHPALLPDFEKGFNQRLRIQQERETRRVASQQPDNRSQAQRMLDFATSTQRTPAKVVEACLEGLSQARKAIS